MISEYAITISPKYQTIDPIYLYKDQTRRIIRILNKVSSHYCLYPEFDNNSRLHYHGIIDIKDLIKWHHIKHEVDQIGYTKLEEFKSFDRKLIWLIYCQKNWVETRTLMPEPIIYKRYRRYLYLTKPKPTKSYNLYEKTIADYFNIKRESMIHK